MADNKVNDANPTGRSLTDVQLDDFDVDRQRERLERSRPGKPQSDRNQDSQQSGEQSQQQDTR
ncbi:hypothetical protein [Massilia sp. BSC265]|uniref:hypothetical protein n=1 Tax=Massilia sp. BSC265 TaxID=1549812 RepID=UPI0004E893B6|nr:hypothetical protein [Massilia sp. BSC265]KFI08172.1 hypothetical protein JN27_05035 [Massilia sp. BSC265]